jgi:hypothetical protein
MLPCIGDGFAAGNRAVHIIDPSWNSTEEPSSRPATAPDAAPRFTVTVPAA